MDVNSRDPSQNIIPFRIKGVEVARFDICGNLGIGTNAPSANLEVAGTVKINGELYVNGRALNSLTSGVVVNMDSQPAPATALNRQKKQSIPLASASTLSTSDIIAKMSGVSVGKTQTYGVGAAQMASYGNIVVAVGSGTNSIAYSLVNPPTASSWVGIPTTTLFNGVANTFSTQGWNITYANGTWVAVGEGANSIAYSTMTPPVASSWAGIPTGSSFNGVVNTFGTRGYDIAYGNGAWVAVGVGTNNIAYSLANPPTAESWVGIPTSFSPTIFGSNVYGITFGNGTWVATGSGTNGIAYSTRTPPTADSWIVVPLTNQNDASVTNTFTSFSGSVIYANGVWLAAGTGTIVLCYSIENPPIASSWMPITSAVLFGTVGRSLAYGNGTWVACGESGALLAYSTARIPHSSSWVAMKGPTPSSNGEIINHVSFNASTNTWYFLGDIGNNCMFYSTATPPVPATWIGVQKSAGAFSGQAYGAIGITTPAFTSPINVARLDNKVTFPVNRMLAVGGGGGGIDVVARSTASPAPATTGTISYSDDDGATWAIAPGGATNAMFSSAADIAAGTSFGVGGSRGANSVAWNGEKWVAGGNGRTNSLAFSDDGGMTWSGITGKSVFSVEARDVAWNGQMWVAVGRGINFSTAYSYDGVTWMGPVDVSGAPTNVFSYDIAGPTAAMSDISGGGNHVVWTGKIWVATGTRTLIAGSSPAVYYTVAYSVDGKTWTGVADSGATSTGFDMYAYGIAWNGRNIVVTGRGTTNTLALSTDVTASSSSSWVGLGNTVFSVWGRGITWGAKRWMATGRGTNTVAFSTNGRNWQGCGANVFKPLRRFMAMGDTGLYAGVVSGQRQRGVAFSYSDDGVTWDAPVVNQGLGFSSPFGTSDDTVRSVIYTNQMLLSNAITDDTGTHQSLMYSIDAGASWSRVPGSSDTEANGGTGMNSSSNRGCYSIATNPTRTRFIAGGGDTASATKKVYFSNDGFNWNRSVSSPNITQFAWVWASLWVGGGYNRWLIGGSDVTTPTNGRIMYSGDADAVAAWVVASPSTFTSTIISCFAANTDFSVILAGATSGNTIYRSANNGGATWTTVSISSTPIGSVRSIAFSPSLGRWVAVGGGGGAANTIIYSTDASGTAWIAPPIQAKATPTAIFKNGSEVTRVIWDALNGGRFIIGGYNGVSDYASFTNVAGLDGVNNNPGYTMAYSADGVNWTPVTIRASDASTSSSGTSSGPFMTRCREIMALDVSGEYTPINTGYSVTWNSYANRFVATGNGTTPVVYSSDGGLTWTPVNRQPQQQAIAVAGGLGAAAGTGTISPITYTIDGKTWSQGIGAKEIFGAGGTVLCVKYGQTSTAISPNGRIWVAGATGGSTSCLAFSQNGIRWTAIANANTMITNVRTIAYAPNASITASSGVGNGVWVAGGDGTNSLIFSYDGISWSEVPGSLGILNRCNACAFGNGLFVAGGTAGTVDQTAVLAYSIDGINWQPIRGTISRISSSASIKCITYGRDERGRGLWVAGVDSASGVPNISLLYSYNGIDWIGVNNSSSLSTTITGIAYGVSATTGQSLWVASVYSSGSSYSFLFSITGRDGWTTVTNTRTGLFELTGTNGATGISYLNGVWYATGLSAGVSTGRTLAYSYEGNGGWFGVYPSSNMYGAVIPTFSATGMNCIATTNEYMIPSSAAGSPTSMVPVRSIGWTAGVGSAYLQHPTLLFGTDATTATATATAISTDGGRSWGSSTVSLGTSAFRGGVCNDAFWNGSIWVAVGYDAVSGAKVATSKDGVTWSQIPAGAIPISGILYSVTSNGTVWMVGGDGSPTNDANTASIAWSSDLSLWTAVANTDTKLYIVKRISWNGMYWVAVGLGTVSAIMYSKDLKGLVWEDTYVSSSSTNKTATIISAVNDVVWGGGRWVAVGRGNDIVGGGGVSILYSADTPVVGGEPAEYAITGRRWTGVASSAQLFPYGASSVCWNGKRFVATGPAYSSKSGPAGNIIAWSTDGISWTAYSTTKTVAPGQRWVAVGSGSAATIATSADGRTWTDVSGSSLLFTDISGASAALVNTMGTGARAIGWNGSSLIVGGARSATTVTPASLLTATATTGRTTIPVCAFIGSGNGVMGGGTTNVPMDATAQTYIRNSSSVFITHLDVNMREASAPYANMWLNTYSDLSATQLFQVTPESQSFSSALKWNGWSWVANFGMTTFSPVTSEKYGSIWYCTDPLARVGWSVASNYVTSRILMGQGGYAALEWNGAAWLACGYDPNNNNLIYTTDKYGAVGWTAVSGVVSSGSASFQPVCIASSQKFWVVGGSLGTTSAIYYTNDRTGATGWKAVSTAGSVLPGIRITSVGYNGVAWICCGGGGGGTGSPASSISWRVDADDIGTGWATATVSGTSGGIPSNMSTCSAIAYNAGAASPFWVVVGDVSGSIVNQVAYTTSLTGSIEWKTPSGGNSLGVTLFSKLNGIVWTGYSWIASCGAGSSRIASTTDINVATGWNNGTNGIYAPTLCTNAVAYANIPISLLTTGMVSTSGVGAGSGAMWRGGVGRAQGLLPGGGSETTSVIVRSSNGAEGIAWSQSYSRNFLIAVGGGVIRDASNGSGVNRMAYSYDGGLSWTTNNTAVLTTASGSAVGSIRTVKYSNGIWVAGGDSVGSSVSGNNCLAWSRDGVNWTGAGGTQIFGSAGSCYAVCCNDRGRWVAVGGAALTTAGTYTNVSGSIYTMAWSDDGMNWTPIIGSRALFGIVCQGVSYGADASGVGMWTAIGRGGTNAGAGVGYTGIAYSYDGKTWFLSQTSASLFGTSANVLTERYSPVASAGSWAVSLSSTGQYQSAVVNGGNIWTSSDYGVSWTSRATVLTWYSISLSSTGQYQSAVVYGGNIWTSSDYGVTWTARTAPGSPGWRSISLSSTGQYQTAVPQGDPIRTSSDYGVTWTSRNTPGSLQWWCTSLSSTGQYQSAVVNYGYIWTSSDYGVTWTAQTAPGVPSWRSISLSSTGQYQTAVPQGDPIRTSSDYGVTWTSRNTPGSLQWLLISLSSTGQYQSAAVQNGNIWTSSDYGVTWTARTGAGSSSWASISLSSTGQYQTAGVSSGLIHISSNFGETWSSAGNDSRSLGITYGKDASGAGMWVATAGRRDRDVAASAANTMAYSYDGKLWRGIAASVGLSEQAWTVVYGKDGFGVGMWVAGGYDRSCGLKWSYDGITWNATTGASGSAVWASMAAGRRALSIYWNGSMWLASTSDTRNGEPSGTGIAANNASSTPGYLLYSYNGKNWLPVLAPNTYNATISASAQPSVYSVLPNPAILDFGSFYDDSTQRGAMIANTTARTVGAVMSGGVPIENVNTIVPYGRGLLTTGQVPFLMGGDSGLVETAAGVTGVAGAGVPPPTSELAASTTSISTSTDGGITWRAVPNSTRVMTKVNKILCDETTQQIVAVGAGNYSVATSTPATAGNADGWVGVFGSRMMNTRTGLFEKYGTGATWFGGAKMWIASGRTQSRRGSSLAVSVNGTVWQDAKIVSQMAAGTAGGARGGGLTNRTTIPDMLYTFTEFTFDNANSTGRTGPDLSACKTRYAAQFPAATWTQNTSYLNMTTNGIQLWTVPATGSYTIRAKGAAGGYPGTYGRGRDISLTTSLTKGDVIKILVGQMGLKHPDYGMSGGGGGTFVVKDTQTAIIVAGGGGGRGESINEEYVNSNASATTTGNRGGNNDSSGLGGVDGNGGGYAGQYSGGGGGLLGNGADTTFGFGGKSFINNGIGGNETLIAGDSFGGFGGGGGSSARAGGGGGGYSGGGAGNDNGSTGTSGGGGGSYGITTLTDAGAINTGNGSVIITLNFTTTPISFNSSVIPYTAPATPLLTYTDSAAAFSTQVSSVATNSQYNRAVVGGSGVQFVAGGRGIGSNGSGLVYSNDGQNWTAVASGAATVFQTPTNVAVYSTAPLSGGFDASFGTVALTQRLSPPTTYPIGTWNGVSVSATGQYQSAVVQNGNIFTSSDYGVSWTARTAPGGLYWYSISLSSTGQYQTAVVAGGNIWTSSDYGVTWASRATVLNWVYISLSSTGQYQSAVVNGGYIWTSSDYGVTWTARTAPGTPNWISISLSSTGQYQSAVVNNGYIWISSDYGVSWASRTAPGSPGWRSISLSSTGQYQTAVPEGDPIRTSSDYGVTWTVRNTPGSLSWRSIAVSSTGQYQSTVVASGGNIWTSSDYGVTWTIRSSPGTLNWVYISLSSTGQYQSAVVGGGNIYTSTNYGVTWVQRSTATRTNAFTRIKSSASGQYQLATSGPVGDANGQLYVSSDYGQTWIPRRGLGTWLGGAVSATGGVMITFSTPTAATAALLSSTDYGNTFTDVPNTTLTGSAYWRSIAVTNSAAVQTAVAYGSSIYRSSDTGSTWSNAGITIDGSANANTVTPRNWQDIAVSAETGAVQVTCVSGGYLYVSSNTGVTWLSSTVSIDGATPQTTNRAWQAVAISANGQYGLACVNSTSASGFLYRSTNSGASWASSSVVIDGVSPQTTNRAWQDVGMSANGKYQVACVGTSGFIYYSKDYGVTWTSLSAAGSRSWSSIALSDNGGTISATTNDAAGAIWTYAMPDDQYYRPPALLNSGVTVTPSTIRAITYGNSGTGVATDGYWVAGADASANTLAYSSNGIDWTAVVGSKTTLFNTVNGVAYGADTSGTPLWVAVGAPFIGSVPGSTAYSIAYSYNMTNWTGVRNLANFTGQGNHVAYGQDEYGAGMWVAVGQGSGALAANLGDSSLYNSNSGSTGGGTPDTTIFYSYDGANWSAGQGAGVFSTSGTDVTWGVDASGVATWVATGVGYTDLLTGVFIPGGQVAHSTNGRLWTPIRDGVTTITPFTTSALSVAYGRSGSQGAGAPRWIIGGSGGNVFAASSRPSATDTGIWTVVASTAPTANAPFPICNSIGYSNGIWVAGNNTDATNVLARSIDGGSTWTPLTLSSVSGILAGSASVGANAFCNYSLAYADYSNDTNLRSWVAVQGTKNFMFEGGVNAVATVTTNIVASTYNNAGAGTRAWWVAGGSGTSSTGVSGAALAYSTDPSGAAAWTKSVSAGIANLATINDIAFSPQTQQWLAVGAGAAGSTTQNVLFSDASGATWTASALATPVTPVITLNTCIWNQLDASASAAGRWLAGGTRNDISVSIPTSATLYISTDTSGAASPWTPIAGTGAILSQVYSAAYNGRVWIAAGTPATDSGSTSTMMSTTDPTGAAGWQGIATTASSISGFDTAARSITWNADQQMWVATGENTATSGSGAAVDASFSSVIYSLDVSGSAGTWRTVRESNSTCFSGQGNGIAFTGRKWFAVGEGTNQIVATTDVSANTVFGTGAAPSWSSAGNANTALPVRGTDIAFTGRNLVATGLGSGSSSGVVISTDPTGVSWSSTAAAGFTDASGGGTSITFEPTYDGAGRLVATGKSVTNSITVSSDGGATWNTSATAPATGVQLSSQRAAPTATTQSLFTTGGNSVAYVGNDTLLGGGGNDVHWTGKRWIATGKNSGVDTATAATTTVTASPATAPDIINNNTSSVAVSDDGITWQCVSSGQAPNIAEGTFIAANSRIGATSLIDSRITIMDGGDTEPMTSDYIGSSSGGMGTGIAQLDIIAELPVTSVSASNTTGAVTTIGVGSNNVMNSVNGVGVTPVASFDNTAFTITTRPV